MLASKPAMHVIIVGGNHDGLLCADDKCLACRVRHGRQPSAALRANLVQMLEGLPAGRVHVLFDQAADVQLANGHVVRVVGSPWTSYNTGGREHLSGSHFWRPEDGFVFGGATLGLPEERLDCAEWWRQHWASIGSLLSAQSTQSGKAIATSVLVTHTPPKGVMDIVGGTKDNSSTHGKRVGCDALRVMLEGLERPPLIHCFGHVHAKRGATSHRRGAPRRQPTSSGTVFANVAAERQLPAITGYRLLRKAAAGAGAAAKLDAGELLALPAPDATAPVPAPELLMRPPVALTLPLNGFACDCAIWPTTCGRWAVGGERCTATSLASSASTRMGGVVCVHAAPCAEPGPLSMGASRGAPGGNRRVWRFCGVSVVLYSSPLTSTSQHPWRRWSWVSRSQIVIPIRPRTRPPSTSKVSVQTSVPGHLGLSVVGVSAAEARERVEAAAVGVARRRPRSPLDALPPLVELLLALHPLLVDDVALLLRGAARGLERPRVFFLSRLPAASSARRASFASRISFCRSA